MWFCVFVRSHSRAGKGLQECVCVCVVVCVCRGIWRSKVSAAILLTSPRCAAIFPPPFLPSPPPLASSSPPPSLLRLSSPRCVSTILSYSLIRFPFPHLCPAAIQSELGGFKMKALIQIVGGAACGERRAVLQTTPQLRAHQTSLENARRCRREGCHCVPGVRLRN